MPRLQRFYSGSPLDWWQLPQELLNCYIDQMPVIEAEEALEQILILQAGSPSQSEKETDSKSDIIRAFEDQADPDGEKRKAQRLQARAEAEIRSRLGGIFAGPQLPFGIEQG